MSIIKGIAKINRITTPIKTEHDGVTHAREAIICPIVHQIKCTPVSNKDDQCSSTNKCMFSAFVSYEFADLHINDEAYSFFSNTRGVNVYIHDSRVVYIKKIVFDVVYSQTQIYTYEIEQPCEFTTKDSGIFSLDIVEGQVHTVYFEKKSSFSYVNAYVYDAFSPIIMDESTYHVEQVNIVGNKATMLLRKEGI